MNMSDTVVEDWPFEKQNYNCPCQHPSQCDGECMSSDGDLRMDTIKKIANAILDAGEGCQSGLVYVDPFEAAKAAIAALSTEERSYRAGFNDGWETANGEPPEAALSTDAEPADSAELISTAKEWYEWSREWSGSAFLNDEDTGEMTQAECKAELYRGLCKLGNHMMWLEDQLRALSILTPSLAVKAYLEAAATAVDKAWAEKDGINCTEACAIIRSTALSAQVQDVAGNGLTLSALQSAHIERQEEWCPDVKPDLSFRGNELGGECGEAQNVIKKLERERHGWRGSRDTVEHLAEELADVIHCTMLVAITAGIDLQQSVVTKFNDTSTKNGLSTRLAAAPAAEQGEAE